MRRILSFAMIAVIATLACGCVQMTKDMHNANQVVIKGLTEDRTVTESYTEHLHRINSVVNHDAKMLVDDWDLFLQRDRIGRLSRWHEP